MVAKLTRIFVSLMRPRLTIKTHIAKLKMIENQEQNKTSAIPKFMPKIILDDETAGGINSLNLKQREAFNVFHALAKRSYKI